MIAAAEHSPLDPAPFSLFLSFSPFHSILLVFVLHLRFFVPCSFPLSYFSYPTKTVYTAFVESIPSPLTFRASFSRLTGVSFFFAVDRSGTGQSGSSPRVTLRLNQVRGTRDEKKGGGAANSRQGGMSAQVRTYMYT